MDQIQTTRVWVGECARQQNITSNQLANAILTAISPENIGNHNKKLMQLLQNIICQLFGEADACLAEHGTITCELLTGAFTNSVAVLFGHSAHSRCTVSADFTNIIAMYTTTHPDIFRPFAITVGESLLLEAALPALSPQTMDKLRVVEQTLRTCYHYSNDNAASGSEVGFSSVRIPCTLTHSLARLLLQTFKIITTYSSAPGPSSQKRLSLHQLCRLRHVPDPD